MRPWVLVMLITCRMSCLIGVLLSCDSVCKRMVLDQFVLLVLRACWKMLIMCVKTWLLLVVLWGFMRLAHRAWVSMMCLFECRMCVMMCLWMCMNASMCLWCVCLSASCVLCCVDNVFLLIMMQLDEVCVRVRWLVIYTRKTNHKCWHVRADDAAGVRYERCCLGIKHRTVSIL